MASADIPTPARLEHGEESRGVSSLGLAWSGGANYDATTDRFEVELNWPGGGTIVAAASVRHLCEGLVANRTFRIRVRTVRGGEASNWSAPVALSTRLPAPPAPVFVPVAPAGSLAHWSIFAVEFDGKAETTVVVWRRADSEEIVVAQGLGLEASLILPDELAGAFYSLQLRCAKADFPGGVSESARSLEVGNLPAGSVGEPEAARRAVQNRGIEMLRQYYGI